MNYKQLKENKNFVGRSLERAKLEQIGCLGDSSIVIVYGRRRVGKTELLEQTYRERRLLKFEGIESKNEQEQMTQVLLQLAEYADEPLLREVKPSHWVDVFKYIARYIKKGKWTLYFEEVQWLADYKDAFVSELKYVWDNEYRYNPELVMILCGSSPSFMVQNVLQSKALYNRSQHEIHLQELNLVDARKLLGRSSVREVLDAYLMIGGIPEYLKRLKHESSVFVGLCKHSFMRNGYFSEEINRIFTSSLSGNKHYKQIIEYLSKRKFVTRTDIAKHLKVKQGGSLSDVLKDLELCGFIQKYTPYNLNDQSKLARYCINDTYLQFYYKFIKPIKQRVQNGDYNNNPVSALKSEALQKWLGFSFERFCRKHHYVIAKRLGFHAINYKVGAFYNKSTSEKDPNYQIDLVFDRSDGILTVCEIKYLQTKASKKLIDELERKISLLPNPKKKTIHRVLISKEGMDETLLRRHYFDQELTIDDFFVEHHWL